MSLKTSKAVKDSMDLAWIKTADDYLSLVHDWDDPNPAPVLETYGNITVVRDDLLGDGAKVRFIDYMLKSAGADVEEWVYGSSPRWGFGQISLSSIAKKYGKKCTLFLAESAEWHNNTKRAIANGATAYKVPMGFMTVCEARARAYVAKTPGSRMVPFGLADDTVYGSIIKVARSLPITPEEVWTVAGSGTLNRGLQLAWPKVPCNMVSVGHVLTTEEIGRATVHRHYLKFAQQCKKPQLPPFPSVGEYDAKAWEYIQKYANPKKKILFWNVGA